MAKPHAQYKNEVKTRLTDRSYEGVLVFMQTHGHQSVSQAIAHIVSLQLFGYVGTLPNSLIESRPEVSQTRPGIPA